MCLHYLQGLAGAMHLGRQELLAAIRCLRQAGGRALWKEVSSSLSDEAETSLKFRTVFPSSFRSARIVVTFKCFAVI